MKNVATFSEEAGRCGDAAALLDLLITLDMKDPRAVASMLAVAIARLARES